jgi:hypothetical protein
VKLRELEEYNKLPCLSRPLLARPAALGVEKESPGTGIAHCALGLVLISIHATLAESVASEHFICSHRARRDHLQNGCIAYWEETNSAPGVLSEFHGHWVARSPVVERLSVIR